MAPTWYLHVSKSSMGKGELETLDSQVATLSRGLMLGVGVIWTWTSGNQAKTKN
jgi:hypothetical protein